MKPVVTLMLLLLMSHCGVLSHRHSLIGKYSLKAYDFSGKRIFDGTLSIDTFEKDGSVKGLCKLVNVAPNLYFGKDGPWEGEVNGDKILLDLAPRLEDAGITLEGHWRPGHISGTVRTESFAGDRIVGTFEGSKE